MFTNKLTLLRTMVMVLPARWTHKDGLAFTLVIIVNQFHFHFARRNGSQLASPHKWQNTGFGVEVWLVPFNPRRPLLANE
jgi:hypothetical protein